MFLVKTFTLFESQISLVRSHDKRIYFRRLLVKSGGEVYDPPPSSILPAFGRLRQKVCEFEVDLACIRRLLALSEVRNKSIQKHGGHYNILCDLYLSCLKTNTNII